MAGRIPKPVIDDLIARVDLVSVIESRIQLTQKGNRFQALCPFHDEKTASFSVNPQKQFFYCFGCGAHGNVIGFLMQYDQIEFLPAVEELAQIAGITLDHVPAHVSAQEDAFALMASVCTFYEAQLKDSEVAIAYLKERGLSGQTAKRFHIGYAPPGWRNFPSRFDQALLLKTGMSIEKNEQQTYDRFRDRIMFPIHDLRGRVIGFGGRSLTADQQPKYLNSPETELFHKQDVLFNLQHAKADTPPCLLVVEGYMDVIALSEFGIPYAVATLGTAVNKKHIQLGLKYSQKLVFCFDGDQAGRNAAWKALEVALPLMVDSAHIAFLFLPDGHDPDSLVRQIGKADFEAMVQQAQPLSAFLFAQVEKKHPDQSAEGRAQFATALRAYLNRVPAGVFRDLMEETLAKRLSLTPSPQSRGPLSMMPPVARRSLQRRRQALTPVDMAAVVLLRTPALASAPWVAEGLAAIDAPLPGLAALRALFEAVKADDGFDFAYFISELPEKSDRDHFAYLAHQLAVSPHVDDEAELAGILDRLREQNRGWHISHLIEKAKQTHLSEAEKQALQSWLAQKNPVKN